MRAIMVMRWIRRGTPDLRPGIYRNRALIPPKDVFLAGTGSVRIVVHEDMEFRVVIAVVNQGIKLCRCAVVELVV